MPFRYLWTIEKQNRGSWHFHIVCNRNFSNIIINELWNNGFTKTTKIHKKNVIGNYLAKYISKENQVPRSKKFYGTSRNLIKPKITYSLFPPKELNNKLYYKKHFYNKYRQSGEYRIYCKY